MLGIIIFAILTFFVIKKLNSVLGEESDDRFFGYEDRQRNKKYSMKDAEKVVEDVDILEDFNYLSNEAKENVKEIVKRVDGFTLQKFKIVTTKVMEEVIKANNNRDKSVIKKFLAGDLSKAVISSFDGENKNNLILVAIDEVKIVDVVKDGGDFVIIVNFKTQQINYITNNNGELIEGSKKEIVNVDERWFFTNDLVSKDNTWFIKKIEAV